MDPLDKRSTYSHRICVQACCFVRDTHAHTDRCAQMHTRAHTGRYRGTYAQTHTCTDRQMHTHRQAHRHTHAYTSRCTHRQTHRHTHRHTCTDRHTHVHTDRHAHTLLHVCTHQMPEPIKSLRTKSQTLELVLSARAFTKGGERPSLQDVVPGTRLGEAAFLLWPCGPPRSSRETKFHGRRENENACFWKWCPMRTGNTCTNCNGPFRIHICGIRTFVTYNSLAAFPGPR